MNSAPCPKCGGTDAKRVLKTIWGGRAGTRKANHVRCVGCGARYNGVTGTSNWKAVFGCVLFQLVVGAGLLVAMWVANELRY